MKKFTVSQNVEIELDGERYLLEEGDMITITEKKETLEGFKKGELKGVKIEPGKLTKACQAAYGKDPGDCTKAELEKLRENNPDLTGAVNLYLGAFKGGREKSKKKGKK